MKRTILLTAALVLSACTPSGIASTGATAADVAGVPAPVTVADKTLLDEKALTGIELAYKAARIAVELGVDTGVIKGATATRFAALDNQAFLAVTTARSAYRTGNAPSYRTALSEAQAAIAGILTLTGKTGA